MWEEDSKIKNLSMTDGWEAMQRMFLAVPANKVMQQNACAYWTDQEKILDSMQEFATAWFERRHAGTRAGLETARRMCEAKSSMDMLQEYQKAMDALERLKADGIACQKQLMTIGALLAKPLATSVEEGKTEAKPSEPQPNPGQRLAAE